MKKNMRLWQVNLYGVRKMKNLKQTGRRAASAASKVLRSGSTGKASKAAAGSALAQCPYKKRK